MPNFVLKAVDFQSTLKKHSNKGKMEIKFASPEVFEYISKSSKTQDEFLKSLKGLSWCDVYVKYKISPFNPFSWKYFIKNFIFKNGLHKNKTVGKIAKSFLNDDSYSYIYLNEQKEDWSFVYPILLKIKSYKTYKRDIAVITFFKSISDLDNPKTDEEKKEFELKFKHETKKLRSFITHKEVEKKLEKDSYKKLAVGLYLKINTKSGLPQLVVDEDLYDFDMKNGWSHNQMCEIMSLAFSIYLKKKIQVYHL